MNIFKKIGELFIGGTAKAVTDTASDVNNIVERWLPNDATKREAMKEINEVVAKATSDARKYGTGDTTTWFDSMVDGASRLVRPLVTLWFFGGLIGWWDLTPAEGVDPLLLVWGENILYFWFGGRVVLKDLPQAIQYLRGKS